MTLRVNVRNGTNACTRILRPAHKPWRCECGTPNPGYRSWCIHCDGRRPKENT